MRLAIKYYWVLLYFLLAFFIYLMVKLSLPYLALDNKAAFLSIKQQYISNRAWLIAFYVHVFTSCFLLLAGFTQFSSTILGRYKCVHRSVGKTYLIVLLFFSAPAGLIMAFYANGGLYSRIAFLILSGLWIAFTALAWYYAVKRNFVAHRNFMIRSFALTCSALTLRLWKVGIVMIFEPGPMDAYRIVAWLGWVPNLLLAEWIIRSGKKTSSNVKRSTK